MWLRENVEAITVAVIMALLIRQFCVEAFKIPTGSMEPTLIGLETNGDRILVNKFVYQVRSPRRFEIIVFRYPLDRSRNFVKRLVGLPGEDIELRDGDLFVNGHIERKPSELQAEMFANWRVYPPRAGAAPWASYFSVAGEGDVAERDGVFRLDSNEEVQLRYFRHAVVASQQESLPVGDREIRVTVELESAPGTAFLDLEEASDRFRLEVATPASGGGLRVLHNGRILVERPHVALEPGRATRLSLSNPDDTVVVTVDGEEMASVEYEPEIGGGAPQSIGFGVRAGKAAFSGVAIYRDLYYTPDGQTHVHVPEGSLFALGDNSSASKDGRLWMGRHATLEDGTDVFTDADARPDPEDFFAEASLGAARGLTDEFGEAYAVDPGSVRYGAKERRPFVSKDLLLGKAFFVFWPPARREGDGWKANWRFVR